MLFSMAPWKKWFIVHNRLGSLILPSLTMCAALINHSMASNRRPGLGTADLLPLFDLLDFWKQSQTPLSLFFGVAPKCHICFFMLMTLY
jgi:hypothetical protein